jgi:hypothetical protein
VIGLLPQARTPGTIAQIPGPFLRSARLLNDAPYRCALARQTAEKLTASRPCEPAGPTADDGLRHSGGPFPSIP